MQTPTSPLNSPICPPTPIKAQQFIDSIFNTTPRDEFADIRTLTFCFGWDLELEYAIKHAKSSGFHSIVIVYASRYLTNYAEMLEIVNYSNYLREDKNEIERVKFNLLSSSNSELTIENALENFDKIIDILDILYTFKAREVTYYFIKY